MSVLIQGQFLNFIHIRLFHFIDWYCYIALPFFQVIDIVDGEYALKYMQKSKDGFKWPVKEDILLEPPDHIIKGLLYPITVKKTITYYSSLKLINKSFHAYDIICFVFSCVNVLMLNFPVAE